MSVKDVLYWVSENPILAVVALAVGLYGLAAIISAMRGKG